MLVVLVTDWSAQEKILLDQMTPPRRFKNIILVRQVSSDKWVAQLPELNKRILFGKDSKLDLQSLFSSHSDFRYKTLFPFM